MGKKVVLVGHCGGDASYLRLAALSAARDVQVVAAGDDAELKRLMDEGADLVLVNRELTHGFAERLGVDLIRRLRAGYAKAGLMLVSNYPEAQAAAVAAGALPGFGKRELGGQRVKQVLAEALGAEAGKP